MKRVKILLAGAMLLAASLLPAQTGEVVPEREPRRRRASRRSRPRSPAAVGRYTEFRSAAFRTGTRRGARCSIATRFADTPGARVQVPGRRAHAAHVLPRPRRRAPPTAPKTGDYFVFTKDIGGNEFYQLYRFDLATGDVTLLTDGKSRNSRRPVVDAPATGSPTPRRAATAATPTSTSIDPPTRRPTGCVAEVEGGGWAPLDWSPDDSKLLVGEYVSVNESYLWLVDVATGEQDAAHARRRRREGRLRRRRASPRTARRIYVTTDKDSEFQRLAYVDLATRQAHVPHRAHPVGRRRASTLSPRRQDASPSSPTRTASACCTCSTPRPARSGRGPTAPVGRHRRPRAGTRTARDLGFTLVVGALARRRRTRSTRRPARSSAGPRARPAASNAATFAEPELVRWKSFDGRTISGFLYRPPAKFTGKRPVIINIHGGPEGQSRPGFLGRNNYFLNELGVAMLFPNVRGSTGYGKTFLTLDNGVQARGLGTRTSARCSTGSRRSPTSTPTASWSPAAATAAT